MTGPDIAAALATAGEMLRRALIAGTPTATIHARIAELEAAKRREDSGRAAAEAAAEAERQREEGEAQAAAVAALVLTAETRLRERISALEPPPAPLIRRTPQGFHFIAEVTDE